MRTAGAALNLPRELVSYIATEAQDGRTDPTIQTLEDQRIVDGIEAAMVQAMTGEGGWDDDPLAGSPSFNLKVPKIPGRDLEGVPNADRPEMREKLRQRLLRNPNGAEDLPGFLKGV